MGADVGWNDSEQKITISIRAYVSSKHKFQVIMPSGWDVDKETEECASFAISDMAYCSIGQLNIDGEEITRDNFTLFANEWLKQYDGKNILSQQITDKTAVIALNEEGVVQFHTIKLLSNGLYYIAAVYPEKSLNQSLGSKLDIVINTLSDL